ncbi:MAG TPA: hypothetical protein VKT70_02610 [Stellaceae bacterium]|nr:hypothetical protein [Stellaceae bacterium]
MAVIDQISLRCSHCGTQTTKEVAWVQGNTFFVCERCGGQVMIDKDLAARQLAALELVDNWSQLPGITALR